MTPKGQFFSRWNPAFLLIAFLFLVASFYYQHNIGGTGLMIPSNITVWLSAIIFIWFSISKVLDHKRLIIPQCGVLVFSFPILATISGFLSGVIEPINWAFKLLFIWGGGLFLLGLFQFDFSRAQKDKLLFILVIAGLLHAIVACMQFFQPEGMTIFLPSSKETHIATGVFQQINVHASFQATVLLICWYLINRPLAMFSRYVKISIFMTTILSTYIVMSSGSRVGFISAFVGLALLLPICWSSIKRNKKNLLMLIIAMALAIGFSIFSSGFSKLIDKSSGVHSEYKLSDRIGIYLISGELVAQKPIFGHGLGSFESVWQYQKADFQKRHSDFRLINDYVIHPHNELLFWQVEGGLFASVGILVSFITIFILAWKSKARYVIAILFPFAFHNQVELPFHISAISWFTCLLLIYIAISHSKLKVSKEFLSIPMVKTLRFNNHVILCLGSIFFIHTLWANYQIGLSSEGKTDLKVPATNPYFSRLAEDFFMQRLFKISSIEHSVQGMQAFLTWQEVEILLRPTDYNFKMLIAANQNMQHFAKACETAQLALEMYSRNDEFQHYVNACKKVT